MLDLTLLIAAQPAPDSGAPDPAAVAATIPTKEQIYQPIDSAIAAIQSMPWGIHAVMGVLVVTGLILWSMGRTVLKPVAGLVGAGLGAFLGFAALPVLFPSANISPYVGLFAGMVGGLIAAIMLCKLATAAAFGVIVGVATAFITGAVMNLRAAPADAPGTAPAPSGTRTGDELAGSITRALSDAPADAPTGDAARDSAASFFGAGAAPPRKSIDEYPHLGPAAAAVRDFFTSARALAAARWNATLEAHRPWVALLGTGALVFAFAVGYFLWNWSSSVVTALIGAAVWLSCAVWLWQAGSLPLHDKVTSVGPANWTIVWLVLGVIGMAIQLKTRRKPAPPGAAPAQPQQAG